ncbi:PepSY-like domain-containing protein [Hymenobacter monticola]|uniref:PepSY-like domain-containing protein n=1 Tax=Hymenobacter monticola TaxID=1705399 RepID=A0ABY4BBV4_9BACT|nr:PepSY-like domain-containing protein [Hymenobacter monticola]UOE36635.1 PepSY-like domain-containing protein [Hymenobacter monticola]
MKKYLLLLALLPLAALSAQAQKVAEKQVPAAVLATFKQAHPTAKGVKWEKEDANYEAGYEQGEEELSVVITPTGTLLETETEMKVAQLPAPVRAALTSQYQGYKVSEAARIVTAATGTTVYEAEVSRAGKKQDLLFNADGTVVKK